MASDVDTSHYVMNTTLPTLQSPQPAKRSRLSLRRKTQILHKPCYEEEDSLGLSALEHKVPKCDIDSLDVQLVDLTQDENASPNCNAQSESKYLVDFEKIEDVRTLGLPNCGNTCYVNSILQVLRYSPNFLTSLHLLLSAYNQTTKFPSCDQETKEVGFFQQLHTLYFAMRKKEVLKKLNTEKDYCVHLQKPVLSVINSLREISPLFEEGQQHDAHELFITIISNFSAAFEVLKNQFPKQEFTSIVKECCTDQPMEIEDISSNSSLLSTNNDGIKKATPSRRQKKIISFDFSSVEDLNLGLEGKMRHVIKCLECERRLEREESFMNLEVNIPEIDPDDSEADDICDTVDLRKCLSQTTTLSGDNKFYCEECQRRNEGMMISEVIDLPYVLLLHFSWLRSSSAMTNLEKTSIKVIIPLTLNTSENQDIFCCSQQQSYKLYAVVLHIGKSTEGGHYVAFIKDAYQNACAESNDEKLSRPRRTVQITQSPELCCVTDEITQFKDITSTSKWLLFDDNNVLSVHIDEDIDTFPYYNYLSVTASPCMIFYHKT